MDAAQLTAEAMRATSSETPGDLARVLGLEAYDSPRRIKRWLEGKNEPTFEMTLKLLALCALPPRERDHVVPIREPLQDAGVLEHIVERLEQFERVIELQTQLLERMATELGLSKQADRLRDSTGDTEQ